LRSDIVWYEEVQIADGKGGFQTVLTPKVYFASNNFNDFDLETGGSMILANNVNIEAGNLINSGNILAKERLKIASTSDINNFGGKIKSRGTASLDAAGSINNKSTIATLTNEGLQTSQASIVAEEGMMLNAKEDINNVGGEIKAGEELALIAGRNIINRAAIDYKVGFEAATRERAMVQEANKIRSTLTNQGDISSGGDLIMVANDNITITGANVSAAGSAAIQAINGDVNIETAELRNRTVTKWGNKRKGGTKTVDDTVNVSSDIHSGKDLVISSGNNTILKAANISTDDGDIEINSANSLLILTATDSHLVSEEIKEKGTFTFKNINRGSFDTEVINTAISAGMVNGLNTKEIKVNTGNQNYVELNEKNTDSLPAYIASLNSEQTIKQFVAETHDEWDDVTRGLTGVSMALIAVAMVALVAVTAGAALGAAGAAAGAATATAAGAAAGGAIAAGAATVGSAMLTAAAVSLSTTMVISATTATMNADGNILGSLDDIGKTTFKETLSEDSLKNVAISMAAAGITAGITAGGNYAAHGSVASPAATISTTFTSQLSTAFKNAAINSVASSAAQSVVNGESFSDSLKDSAKNIILSVVGQMAANQIGSLAHPDPNDPNTLVNPLTGKTVPKINTIEQLALHGALGCGLGMAGGGGCASGAMSGIVGEMVGSSLRDNVQSGSMQRSTAIQISGLAGAAASLATGVGMGQDDADIANDIFAGQRIGSNAAENNALMVDRSGNILDVKRDGDKGVYIDNQDGGSTKDERVGETEYIDEFIIPESGNIPTKGKIHFGETIDDKIKGLVNSGGSDVSWSFIGYDIYDLKNDSLKNGKFDVKTTLGAFDGYLLNDKYISGRSAGNYLAGANAAQARPPIVTNNFWRNFTLDKAGALHDPNTGKEIPYSTRRIIQGFKDYEK
ncbi:MAG: filamentous hemagglutinin, partial [Lentimonas sp.]